MSDTDATQTRQAVAVDEVLDFLDYEVGNDDHIFYDTYSELHDMVSELGYENAKLRELCAGLLTGYECGYGELCKGCTWDGIGDSKTFSCLPRAKARELGVEVDA